MINFKALRKVMERMDGSRDGKFGRCGNWKIALGGYDMGKALKITPEFDNVGNIDDNGDYNVSESGISKRVKIDKK